MNKKEFVAQLSKLRSNATFLTLLGYRNAHSEVADYSIAFHISYENALQRSIDILKEYNAKDIVEKQAKKELIDGYERSLIKAQTIPMEEIDDSYTRFFDGDRYIKGVKMLTKTGELHLYGLVNFKRILMPGMYAKTNSKELTIVKNKLSRLTPVGKFRQFKIIPSQLDAIVVEKLQLFPPV